jgi:hypothetical protein
MPLRDYDRPLDGRCWANRTLEPTWAIGPLFTQPRPTSDIGQIEIPQVRCGPTSPGDVVRKRFPVARYLWKGAHNLRKRLSQGGVASSSPVVRLPKAIQPVRRRSRRGRSRAHETSRVHHAASLLEGTGASNGYRLYLSFNRAITSRPSGASAAVFL